MLQHLIDLDTRLLFFFNGPHNHFFDGLIQMSTSTLTWLPLALVMLWLIIKHFDRRDLLTMFFLLIVLFTMTDSIASHVLRPYFQRLRPCNLDNPIVSQVYIFAGRRGGPYGFPSAHASNAFGIAVFLMLLFRNKALNVLFSVWALYVCYTRLYLGRHYPGDLLGGALLGVCSAVFVYLLLRCYRPTTSPRKIEGAGVAWLVFVGTLFVLCVVAPFLPSAW